MKRCGFWGLVGCLLLANASFGQQSPSTGRQGASTDGAELRQAESASADPYRRPLRQESDARSAVRRKAEFRTQQRMARLAALKWYGLSNSRPVASATPFSGQYSPAWTANSRRPFGWVGPVGSHAVVIYSSADDWR